MNPVQFLVAKYIPDLRRMEPHNIGVVIWLRGGVAARFVAERLDEPGEVDGRTLPGCITSLSAYKQWIRYWRRELDKPAIRPVTGGEPVSRTSPQFVKALAASSRGNFVLIESGQLLDEVSGDDLPSVLDHLYKLLVEEAALTDEPRDPSLEDLCQKLIDETQATATPFFHRNFPLTCSIRDQAQETFEFSYAFANGRLLRLYQQLQLPKRKKLVKRNVHDVAWMFEKVIDGNTITPDQGGILVYPTNEQMQDVEVLGSLQMLGSITRVLNLQDYEAIKQEFQSLPHLEAARNAS